ncbi:MAG: D-alanyl-D-alanine carboxypeptidase family protein [Bacilli bacterium]
MAKKRKLKKSIWVVLILLIIVIGASIYGYKKYQEYLYEQTYEYKLLTHGYNMEETKLLENVFNEDRELDNILTIEKSDKIISLLKEKYFIKKNYQDYLTYIEKNKNKKLEDVVRTINTKINNKHYTLDLKTDMSKGTSILVNKYYQLDSTYKPDDLVTISTNYSWGELGDNQTRQVTYDAFLNMWQGAKDAGYYLMVNSSFRTYQSQEEIFNYYKETKGEKYADSLAARPGYSEHQSGLALDIFSKQNTNKKTFKDSETAKWLKENSYKYGFILRYPEEITYITGYDFEAWHYRYVGNEIAEFIFKNNISFEEYYAFYLDK